MMRSCRLPGLALLAVLCAAPAHAFQWSGNKWPTPTTGFHVDIPGANGLWNTAFQNAMTEWAATVFQFTIFSNSLADPCADDLRNGVGFRSDVCGFAFGSTTLAITQSRFIPGTPGELIEADIIFNSNELWDVFNGPLTSSVNDFKRVAVHELGHAIGLSHEDNVASIMATFQGDIEVPQQDDVNAILAIYGGTPPPGSCETQTPLGVNTSVSGTITGSCTIAQLLGLQDNSGVEQYLITLPTDGRLTLIMQSTELDSFLWLFDAGLSTSLATDDDSGGGPDGFDAQLSLDLAAGTYVVLANAFSPGQTGSFTLTSSLAPTSPLVAAVLPASRSVQVGNTATAFATMINTATVTATGCSIAPLTSVPASFSYQTTDLATNALIGTPNTPVDIAPGGFQSFVFALAPTSVFNPSDVQLNFDCFNTDPAPVTVGVNTLLLSASNTPEADVIALAATVSGDGVVRLPGPSGSGAFAVATVNVGTADTITASADTGSRSLPLALSICETNPTTGVCLAPAAATVTSTISNGATPTFAVFIGATGEVVFDPALSRVFVRFRDLAGSTRGSTSVAVTTAP